MLMTRRAFVLRLQTADSSTHRMSTAMATVVTRKR